MNENTRNQTGSPSRDAFKRKHKDLAKYLYACDVDFVLIDKEPFPDITAILDYKATNDDITFSEVIAYNGLIKRGLPVYIVQGDVDSGQFVISRYLGGNHRRPIYQLKEICKTSSWKEFENWETRLRCDKKMRFSHREA